MKSNLIKNFVTNANILQFCIVLSDKDRNIRETVIKILRYISITPQAFHYMINHHAPLLIARSIEREPKASSLNERFQALKLISHWVENDPTSVPKIFFQSMVAVAGYTLEDQLKKPIIEVLRKGSVVCTSLCAWSGGFKVLAEAITDPLYIDLSENLVSTFLCLLDDPKTRSFFRFSDLGSLFSIFTEISENKVNMKKEVLEKLNARLELGKRAIIMIVKTWTGLIFLGSDVCGLKSLIQMLNQPARQAVKEAIFDILFTIINPGEVHDEGVILRESTNIVDTYIATVVQLFDISGAYEVLINAATYSSTHISKLALKLLKKLIQLSSIFFPIELKLSPLIKLSSDFHQSSQVRFQATKALRELNNCQDRLLQIDPEVKDKMSMLFLRGIEYASVTSLNPMQKDTLRLLKTELDYGMSSDRFKVLLKGTNVNNYKNDGSKWDWNLLLLLFESCLRKSSKVKDLISITNSLLRYFQPSKEVFAGRPWTHKSFACGKVGHYTLKSLLETKEGIEQLASPQEGERSFLTLYAEQLELEIKRMQAIKDNLRIPKAESCFNTKSIMSTMSRECVSWLGIFTESKDGIELLRKANIFSLMEKLGDNSGITDHLCIILINSFDYRYTEEPKNILRLWIEKASKELILYIIEHLRTLYRSKLNLFSTWCIEILVTQINSTDKEIVLKALSVLEEICEDKELIKDFLSKRPQIDKLELGGDPFLANLSQTKDGIRFLQECSIREDKWIDNAIKRWLNTESSNYAEHVEQAIQSKLSMSNAEQSSIELYTAIDCSLDIRNNVLLINR